MYTRTFNDIDMKDVSSVGGKNASLGEMVQKLTGAGINVPDGFATTAEAYWKFLDDNNIRTPLAEILGRLDTKEFTNLREIGEQARTTIMHARIPDAIREAITAAYRRLCSQFDGPIQVAVRSSATAEDLPTASFAGQLESYLNITGEEELLDICLRCYASLFTNRAIKYRNDNGFEHMKVALSIGVQQMVRSDKACSGVIFTIDPETGFDNVILISGSWGLGENIVQGTVTPDEFVVFKPSLLRGKQSIISQRVGEKQQTMVYAELGNEAGEITVNRSTPQEQRERLVLHEKEVELLARWALTIEQHYERPMDIEWAKDGVTGKFYIVQARPETVHTTKDHNTIRTFSLKEKGKVLATGISLGNRIAAGKARILSSPAEADKLQKGEVLVTDITNPDWDPVMKKAAAVVTNKGGRTSHAAIVARELGIVAVVGTGNATDMIQDGQEVTVSCAEGKQGKIYAGLLDWEETTIDVRDIAMPNTQVMLILGDPDKAFSLSFLPNNGIGLMRLEFIINNSIRVHPMALVHFDKIEDDDTRSRIEELTRNYESKEHYFVHRLAQAVGTIAAAFYPKDVIVRMSDFKSNEYANLIGGTVFEPKEENPMIGFRGASRYYNERYREGFKLECEAMKRVRNEMGFTNVKLMIPFCRTVEEGRKVVELMEQNGLKRGDNALEIYVMVEIPSNVLLADKFAEVFDGFSIGSNDLTQLTLGLDRDSTLVSDLFNEQNEAVQMLIAAAIRSARNTGTKIGLCGQAPSDIPEFARFLVQQGIDSISFNPDALFKGIENIAAAEQQA